jgi:hypothetical protein
MDTVSVFYLSQGIKILQGVCLDGLSLVATGFRAASVLFGLVLACLVIVIYRKTRGGSSGWLCLMLAYSSLGVWGLSQLVFLAVFPSYMARILTGTALFFLIGITHPLAAVLLSRDMKLKVPPWFNKRNLFVLVMLFYLAMVAYNFLLTSFTEPFAEVLTITLLSVGVFFLAAAFGFWLIFRGTQVSFWMFMAISSLVAALGVGMVVAFTDCCGADAPLQGADACQSWIYDYADALPAPCVEGLLPLSSNGVLLILLGEIFAAYALFRMLRVME